MQFIWIILWLFILQRCLASAWRAGRGGWWSISGATWHRSAVDRVTELTWGHGTVTMEAPFLQSKHLLIQHKMTPLPCMVKWRSTSSHTKDLPFLFAMTYFSDFELGVKSSSVPKNG